MNKALAKTTFGQPSPETAARIDYSDQVTAAAAAMFRYNTKMRELECHFEQKASDLRVAVLAELAEIQAGDMTP